MKTWVLIGLKKKSLKQTLSLVNSWTSVSLKSMIHKKIVKLSVINIYWS